jgi:acyl carrier protein
MCILISFTGNIQMDEKAIFGKLEEIIFDIKGEIEVNNDTALIGSDIMDSLELINYLTQIEENFDVSITMDELIDNELGLIKNMIKYIKDRI